MSDPISRLLEGPGTPARWMELCWALQRARTQDALHFDGQILPDVECKLATWDDAVRVAPSAWTLRYFDSSEEDPLLGLPRVLRYRNRDDYLLRKRAKLELSRHIAQIHTLDLHVDHPHNDHVRPVLEILGAHAQIATLCVTEASYSDLNKAVDLPLMENLTALRFYETHDLDKYLPARAKLRELSSDSAWYTELPERDWILRLQRLFVYSEGILAIARQIEGLQGLTTDEDLDSLLEGAPRWDLRALRLTRELTPEDVVHLAELPGLAALEELEAEAELEVQQLLIEARAAGKLPALRRVQLVRDIYGGGDLANRNEAPHFEKILGQPLERSVLRATPAGPLAYTEFVVGPNDLIDDELELVPEKFDELLTSLEGHAPHTLKVVVPDPVILVKLLQWPSLGEVLDLVLVFDTFDAMVVPCRVDDREIALLGELKALERLERLHLALSFNRDDRWRIRKMAELPALAKLYTLDLAGGELLNEDIRRLLKSSLFSGVVRLSLAGNRCTNVSDLFRKDDGTFQRLEYFDCGSITSYGTDGEMTYGLEKAKNLQRLTTLNLEGSCKTEFGERLDEQFMGKENLPSLAEVHTSHYYFTIFE